MRPPDQADDAELLRRYAAEHDEAAFAELTRRHLDAVYSSALRRCQGDTHAARDVAQQVFIALARHAGKLVGHPALVAWLFTATRNEAGKLRRTEHRRRVRETTAMNDGLLTNDAPAADWSAVRPVLEDALDELNDADRVVVLLRFFERRTFAEVGARIGVNDHAARMRTERALERLRGRLAARGITSSTVALGAVLTAHAVAPAPAGVASWISSAALGAASGTSLAVWWSWLVGTAKVAATNGWVVGTAAAVIAGGTTLAVLNRRVTLPDAIAAQSTLEHRADPATSSEPTSATEPPTTPDTPKFRGSNQATAGTRSRRSIAPTAVAPSGTAGGTHAEAEALWQRVLATYAGLSSYRDTATVAELRSTTPQVSWILRFETAYRSPDRFAFKWEGKVRRSDGQILPAAGRIWIRGTSAGYITTLPTEARRVVAPEEAVVLGAPSYWAAADIPALLSTQFRQPVALLGSLHPHQLGGECLWSNVPCRPLYAVTGDDERWQIYVGSDDTLVRRIFWTAPRALRAALLNGSAPADSPEALLQRRIVETRENIRVNEALPDSLFADSP